MALLPFMPRMMSRAETKHSNDRRAGLVSRLAKHSRGKTRLAVEALEDRLLLSTSIPLNSDSWTALGPAPLLNGQTPGNQTVSGRITGIAADPSNANTIYVATAGGGVWKTIDGGASWTTHTDNVLDESGNPVTTFMGAIAIAPSDPTVIYAGTGETHGSDSGYGQGVFKSVDAGETWVLLDGDTNDPSVSNQFARHSISKIVVSPTDPQTVYVAVGRQGANGLQTNTGIWMSTDGGSTWSNTTSAISTTAEFSDLVMDPTNPGRLFAAVGTRAGSGVNGVYVTTTGGTGASPWQRAGDFPTGADPEVGRISLAIAPSAPQTLYAAIVDASNGNAGDGNLYKMMTTSNGQADPASITWTQLTNTPEYLNKIGWYASTLLVDPNNASVVYAGGGAESILETTNGGASWSDISLTGTSSPGPHADHQASAFDSAGRFLDGNDGGIVRLDNPTIGNISWSQLNGNLNTIQFTGIALDPSNADIAYGGSQDNGIEKFSDSLGWQLFGLGDGGFARVDPAVPDRVFFEHAKVNSPILERKDPGGDPSVNVTPPFSNAELTVSNFYMPVVLDSANSNRSLMGSDRVYLTSDKGNNWTPISAPNTPSSGWTSTSAIDSLAFSLSDPNTFYAAAGNQIFVTSSGGGTGPGSWSSGAIAGSVASDRFRDLAVDPNNSNVAYAVQAGFTGGNRHVFMTTDGGATWTDISCSSSGAACLPDVPTSATELVANGPGVADDVLFVGTDQGVYASTHNPNAVNSWNGWTRFSNGLATAAVTDLEYSSNLNILGAGTHGRGLWEIELPSSSISGTVFLDSNGDGIQNDSSTIDVTVTLWNTTDGVIGNGDDVQVDTRSTGALEEYEFANLTPGVYYLEFTPPAGFVISPKDQGGDDSLDSDASRDSGKTDAFTLGLGVHDHSRDVGMFGPDRFEDNDTQSTAANLGVIPGIHLHDLSVTTAADDDWYQVEKLCMGDDIVVGIEFRQQFGGFDLEVLDSTGASVGLGTSAPNVREVTIPGDASAGTYFIHVFGSTPDVRNVYKLRADSVGAGRVFYVNDDITANDIYSEAVGDNSNAGLDPQHPKATVQSVLDDYDLGPNDLVLVDTGTYFEGARITFDDEAACGFAGVPAGASSYMGSTWTLQDADFTTIYSLGFELGGGIRGVSDAGSPSANNTFRRNEFDLDAGIVLDGGDGQQILENKFDTVGNAIQLTGGGAATIRDNKFINTYRGISGEGTSTDNLELTIQSNRFEDSTYGIELGSYAATADIHDNVFLTMNGTGVRTGSSADIHDNSFDHVYQGIELFATATASVHANDIGNATYGVMSHSSLTNVFGNDIHDSAVGIAGVGTFGGLDWSQGQTNVIHDNTTGVFAYGGAVVRFNRIAHNATGVLIQDDPFIDATATIEHNLIYRNTLQGIRIDTGHDVAITNNTIYAPSSIGVRVHDFSQNIGLRNNIVWAAGLDGVDVRIADDSQRGFSSDYNNLYATGGAIVVDWQKPFADLFDWQVEADFDSHSIGMTDLAPSLDDPQFANLAGDDFHLLASSTSIDAGDPAYSFLNEPAPDGGRIDLGAYGNTADATPSRPSYIEVDYPNYYTDFVADSTRAIVWHTYNVSGSVFIELYEVLAGGDVKVVDITTVPSDQGVFGWTPSASSIDGTIDRRYRVRISSTLDPSITDASREPFSIPPDGAEYFVDDNSNANDEFTPNATGNNRNTGRSADDPKANLLPILRSYDLDPGDTVQIDTGDYEHVRNVILSGSPALGDDEGASFVGPSDPHKTAHIDRDNPYEGTTNIDIDDGDFVTLRHLTLTGARRGLWVHDSSTHFTGFDLVVSQNSGDGIVIESDAEFTDITRLTADTNIGDGMRIQTAISSLTDSTAHHNGGVGIALSGQTQVVIDRNMVFNNHDGIIASGGVESLRDNISHDNSQIGLSLSTSLTTVIQRNDVSNNAYGMSIENSGATDQIVVGSADLGLGLGNKVHENTGYGIQGSGNVLVAGNTITGVGTGTGIQLNNGADASLNVVEGHETGISSSPYSNSDIAQNRVADSSVGIVAYGSANVRSNVVYTGQVGLFASGFYSCCGYVTFTGQVQNNLIYDQTQRGVVIEGPGTGMAFENNTVFEPDGTAVRVQSPGEVGARDAQLRNNILVSGSSYVISVDTLSQVGFSSDFNLLRAISPASVGFWQGRARTSLQAWQNATFGDRNSIAADPAFVDPDGADNVLGFDSFGGLAGDGRDDDFHEQSRFGSFHGGSFAPVVSTINGLPTMLVAVESLDAVQSPAIDRGDSASDFSSEPTPNGGFINLGTYGGTEQASKSPLTYVIVTTPDGGERWPAEQTFTVRWRSHDLQGTVDIDLVDFTSGAVVMNIANDTENDGEFDWQILASTPAGSNYAVRITRDDGSGADASNSPFAVTPAIHTYYVDDDSNSGDVFTPNATGDDGNDGFFPDSPKASIRALLEAYDLGPLDTIKVDSGLYELTANILITANDSGVHIEGASTAAGTFYRDAVLGSGPIAYWRLGETTGAVASDSSGHGNAGTYIGNPLLNQPGALGADDDRAVTFRGNGDAVDFGSGTGLNVTTSTLTVEAWVKPSLNSPDRQHYIFLRLQDESDSEPEVLQYGLYVDQSNALGFVVNTSDGLLRGFAGRLQAGVFSHVAATYDGNQVRLYINGELVGQMDVTGDIIDLPVARTQIGAFAMDANNEPLTIDEVAVYDKALTAEVLRHHSICGLSLYSTILDRDNVAFGSYVFELQDADGITLDHMTATAAAYGVFAAAGSDSDDLTMNRMAIFGNRTAGVVLDDSNDHATLTASALFGLGGNLTYDDQPQGVELSGEESTVSGNEVHHAYQTGISVLHGMVASNTVYSTSLGIYALDAAASDNTVHDSDTGISGGVGAQLVDNIVFYNATGIVANGSSVDTNTVHNNSSGIVLRDSSARGNIVTDNTSIGISLESAGDVDGNTVSGSQTGILVSACIADQTVHDNQVFNNQTGIYLQNRNNAVANRVYNNAIGIDGHVGGCVAYIPYSGEIANNVVYNSGVLGIRVVGGEGARITNNTVSEPTGDGVAVLSMQSGITSHAVDIRNNIVSVATGTAITVDAECEFELTSDFNLLQTTGSARVGSWQGVTLASFADWFYEVGQDAHSITGNPQFVDPDGADGILGFNGGVNGGADDDFRVLATSPSIDAGDLSSYYLSEPISNGGRINLGHTGNTALATASPVQAVQLLTPNGLERYEAGQQVPIEWRSSGLTAMNAVALVNVGDDQVDNWLTDRFGHGAAYHVATPGPVVIPAGLADAAPPEVYESYSETTSGAGNTLSYLLPVPDGSYTVRLHFAEPFNIGVGDRVFDIILQNGDVEQDGYDILSVTGAPLTADIQSFAVTASAGAGISIDLVSQTYNPALLSAIEVLHQNASGSSAPTFDLTLSTNGGSSFPASIATTVEVDRFGRGSFLWSAGPETDTARVRVAAHGTAVSDTSNSNFIVANAGVDYYIDDASNAGDTSTPNAVGNDSNSGKTPLRPMKTLAALVAAYDLEPGDVIHVDNGDYFPLRATQFTDLKSGVHVEGPTSGVATFNRLNPNTGSYILELAGGNHVTVQGLSLTGANTAIFADEDARSDAFTLDSNRVFNNSQYGVHLKKGNDDATISANILFATPGAQTEDDQLYGIDLGGLNSTVTGNTLSDGSSSSVAIHFVLGSAELNVIRDFYQGIVSDSYPDLASLILHNTTQRVVIGIQASGSNAIVNDNEVLDGGTGIQLYSGARAVSNHVHGNATGIVLDGNSGVASNFVFDNDIGISTSAYASGTIRDNTVYHNTGVGIRAYNNTSIINNKVYSNSVGIQGVPYLVGYSGSIANNLVYANTNQGIMLVTAAAASIENNTVYQPTGDAVRIDSSSSNITHRNNILWVDTGYDLFVSADSQSGFESDYNLLYHRGAGQTAQWQGISFATLADWFYGVAYDSHSTESDPLFVDFDGPDNLLGFTNGADHGSDDNFDVLPGSPSIDTGDLGSYYLSEPISNGGRVNLGYTGNTPNAAASPTQPFVQVLSPNVGSSRVDLQACKLEYSIVSPK